jgi:hypothetical protein
VNLLICGLLESSVYRLRLFDPTAPYEWSSSHSESGLHVQWHVSDLHSVYCVRLLDPAALWVELQSLGIWPERPMACQ